MDIASPGPHYSLASGFKQFHLGWRVGKWVVWKEEEKGMVVHMFRVALVTLTLAIPELLSSATKLGLFY